MRKAAGKLASTTARDPSRASHLLDELAGATKQIAVLRRARQDGNGIKHMGGFTSLHHDISAMLARLWALDQLGCCAGVGLRLPEVELLLHQRALADATGAMVHRRA